MHACNNIAWWKLYLYRLCDIHNKKWVQIYYMHMYKSDDDDDEERERERKFQREN